MNDAARTENLQAAIGRIETRTDLLDPAHVATLAATLDYDWRPAGGEHLPPLWHWAFFRPLTSQSGLGADGHPQLGGFLPSIALPRRMWVGGRLTFHHPLEIGAQIARRSEIMDISTKSGRNGHLVFVTLRHEISDRHGLAITEEQDLVYREASTATYTPPPPLADAERPAADWRLPVTPDPVLLFRYSAVTFNSHRIHYDAPYARGEEGYPGLVVHGPLIATLLVDRLCSQRPGPLRSFSYRAEAPLFCDQKMALCGRAEAAPGQFSLWAETPEGRVAMSGSAILG
jgi:3-methylfumaryl-CoA hydratase